MVMQKNILDLNTWWYGTWKLHCRIFKIYILEWSKTNFFCLNSLKILHILENVQDLVFLAS
jgi:hypothetical protein